jgi:hypothetical protein
MTKQNLDLDKLREHLEKARTNAEAANNSQLVVTREGTMRLDGDSQNDREHSKVDVKHPFATADSHQ